MRSRVVTVMERLAFNCRQGRVGEQNFEYLERRPVPRITTLVAHERKQSLSLTTVCAYAQPQQQQARLAN
jgi:hypothetical protein